MKKILRHWFWVLREISRACDKAQKHCHTCDRHGKRHCRWRGMINNETLEPCPYFNDCDPELLEIIEVESFVFDHAYKARCDDCGAEGPVMESEKEAIRAWNRR